MCVFAFGCVLAGRAYAGKHTSSSPSSINVLAMSINRILDPDLDFSQQDCVELSIELTGREVLDVAVIRRRNSCATECKIYI